MNSNSGNGYFEVSPSKSFKSDDSEEYYNDDLENKTDDISDEVEVTPSYKEEDEIDSEEYVDYDEYDENIGKYTDGEIEYELESDYTIEEEDVKDPSILDPDIVSYLTKTVEIDGVEVALNDPKVLQNLITRGVEYTKKLDSSDVQSRALKTLEHSNISLDSEAMKLFVETLQGNSKAAAKLVKIANIPSEDLDHYLNYVDEYELTNYKPNDYIYDPAVFNLKSIFDEMMTTPEGSQTVDLVNSWDSYSQSKVTPELLRKIRDTLSKDENALANIQKEIKKSTYFGDVLDIYDIDKYTKALDRLEQRMENKNKQQAKIKALQAKLPKSISTKYNPTAKKIKVTGKDIMNMSAEEYAQFKQSIGRA